MGEKVGGFTAEGAGSGEGGIYSPCFEDRPRSWTQAVTRRHNILDSSLRSEYLMRVATLTTWNESVGGLCVVTGLMTEDGFPPSRE